MRRALVHLSAIAVLSVAACGQPTAPVQAQERSQAPAPDLEREAAAQPGDELLREARASLRGGHLSEVLESRLLESEAPAHARARRLLAFMDGQGGEAPPPLPSRAGGRATTPSLVAPPPAESTAPTSASIAPVVSMSSSSAAPRPRPNPPATSEPPSTSAGSAPATSGSSSRPQLRQMSLRSSRNGGAELTLTAGHGLMVGIVKEPSRNTVRLLVDKASALPNVLGARPKARGVAVTGIRRGTGTVQINLQLESGWTVGHSRRTAGGATITFHPPNG